MGIQTESGKAFEYALIRTFKDTLLSYQVKVEIKTNKTFNTAQSCFEKFSQNDKNDYMISSERAINHLIDLEPRLNFQSDDSDILQLEIMPDSAGISGDVRDVIAIRSLHDWEIGISAKNNHADAKHSRLSDKIDFGKEWFGISCSSDYFQKIHPIFLKLKELKEQKRLWRDLKNKSHDIYIPLLNTFKDELQKINELNMNTVPKKLIEYLLGKKDFYKVIKRNKFTEIHGYNLYQTLNQSAGKNQPKIKIPKLRLPSRIIELDFKPDSDTSLFLYCDEGWQISFRIHNASSKVEPSLKFAISLIGNPSNLYSHSCF
ncbi:MAG: restriction endonuclease [Spirochaetes bacterium GWF1_49_6]|nr:MAG: restriction endonuclease [Spirochaetes bacterium GWF1_49_6]